MADYYEIGTAKIVSENLKNIFLSIGVDCEYVPIKTLDGFNNSRGAYYLAHFHPILDCFDYDRSHFTWAERKSGKRPINLKCLAISDSNITRGLLLFRIKHFENRIIVKDRMYDLINDSDIRGILFLSTGKTFGRGIGEFEGLFNCQIRQS